MPKMDLAHIYRRLIFKKGKIMRINHWFGILIVIVSLAWPKQVLATPITGLVEQKAPLPLAALPTFTKITVGSTHTCAITSSGGVKCWGDNTSGQLGDGTTILRNIPVNVIGLTSGVIGLAAGAHYTCALTSTGGVKCWGSNYAGQLGDGTTTQRLTPVNVNGMTSGATALTAGGGHTCVITNGSGVKCWGANDVGQLGDSTLENRTAPVSVNGLSSGVTKLGAGGDHTCAVSSSGGVKCWGRNSDGELGDGTYENRSTPVNVSGLSSGVAGVSTGYSHSCALTSPGGVKCWGRNNGGQLGDGTFTDRTVPVDVNELTSGVTELDAGGHHTCVIASSSGVKCWGKNEYGQLGDDSTKYHPFPVNVNDLANGVISVKAGYYHTCALFGTGRIKCWGRALEGQLGDGFITQRTIPLDVVGLTSGANTVSSKLYHTCVVTNTGGLKCWGVNYQWQLGDGTYTDRTAPVTVIGLTNDVTGVTTGSVHTCALTSAGEVLCWGANHFGQLGNGTIDDQPNPVHAGVGMGVTALAAGANHTCAVHSLGGVSCWGSNSWGQLGDGTTYMRATPVEVSGLTSGVTGVAANYSHSCALTTSGGVKCWGNNENGQLGDGTTTQRLTPVDVIGLTNGVMAISLGPSHSCALTTTGGVKCWGLNDYGQLGDGTKNQRSSPVAVTGLSSGGTALSAGSNHTCAIADSGRMKCWGLNEYGQLGDGTLIDRSSPVDVTGLNKGVISLATGSRHTCAVTSAGGVKCWGCTIEGQLGIGISIKQLIPSPVMESVIPHISINHLRGAVGSYFTVTGENFPPNAVGSVTINGHSLTSSLQVNQTGGFIFFINTAGAEEGRYVVTVNSGAGLGGLFILDASEPLNLQSGGGLTLDVPAGIATANQMMYLPLVTIY